MMECKIISLAEKARGEKGLLPARLTAEALIEAWQDGRAVFIENESKEKIISCGVLWFRKNSVEIGSLWTDSDYRSNGYAKKVFMDLIRIAPKNLRLFIIANNPSVARLAIEHGMQEADRKDWLSAASCSDCSLCDRLPESDRPRCSLKNYKEGRRIFFLF